MFRFSFGTHYCSIWTYDATNLITFLFALAAAPTYMDVYYNELGCVLLVFSIYQVL